jgi:hypothetical protein
VRVPRPQRALRGGVGVGVGGGSDDDDDDDDDDDEEEEEGSERSESDARLLAVPMLSAAGAGIGVGNTTGASAGCAGVAAYVHSALAPAPASAPAPVDVTTAGTKPLVADAGSEQDAWECVDPLWTQRLPRPPLGLARGCRHTSEAAVAAIRVTTACLVVSVLGAFVRTFTGK